MPTEDQRAGDGHPLYNGLMFVLSTAWVPDASPSKGSAVALIGFIALFLAVLIGLIVGGGLAAYRLLSPQDASEEIAATPSDRAGPPEAASPLDAPAEVADFFEHLGEADREAESAEQSEMLADAQSDEELDEGRAGEAIATAEVVDDVEEPLQVDPSPSEAAPEPVAVADLARPRTPAQPRSPRTPSARAAKAPAETPEPAAPATPTRVPSSQMTQRLQRLSPIIQEVRFAISGGRRSPRIVLRADTDDAQAYEVAVRVLQTFLTLESEFAELHGTRVYVDLPPEALTGRQTMEPFSLRGLKVEGTRGAGGDQRAFGPPYRLMANEVYERNAVAMCCRYREVGEVRGTQIIR